ncbi:putative DNA repair protein rad-5 [Xylona heveae TC161]|uniref:Putative DNA repair protein rad-5 n=1 Tax=Xylona heveae (strain CBS 132557 / TC161) TaxID=1328760 RepID=A0A165JW64_XYLHT|nr:putative DNA repair protein rad-5 [Xylona heveae TC161]KZF26698.1 putative DNA repair protein rad-5 [Xylona heveae TC161]
MSYGDVDPRPTKKRRFFAEESSGSDSTLRKDASLTDELDALPEAPPVEIIGNDPEISSSHNAMGAEPTADGQNTLSSDQPSLKAKSGVSENATQHQESHKENGFDTQVFATFVGEELPPSTMKTLRQVSGDNMERAINMYFDGSWKATAPTIRPVDDTRSVFEAQTQKAPPPRSRDSPTDIPGASITETRRQSNLQDMPEWRYIGAFGVGGWATKSGLNLLRHGESVKIERAKIQPPTPKLGRSGKVTAGPRAANRRGDIIVRFTNSRGEEIGRLPKETAAWVSTLIDQKICRFDGVCVYTPIRIRTNDTIYLQLRCSLLRRAFEAGGFVKPSDNNRTTGLFEAKETEEEKDLRLRQTGLIKLFDEINLHPLKSNEQTLKHKRKGLLQAAEMAEHFDESKKPKPDENNTSSPPSSEDAEEGEELEQDQLDTLYKKAQTFDFDTPVAQPADTFAMDLRPYQRQALHWMIQKEKDEKRSSKEVSMHPLWEEYSWPTKDVDDKDLPQVVDQDKFYVNPYSGELSLDFPVQEQNCLGGILADEMGLGKTIEMLSLVHTHKSDIAIQASQLTHTSVNELPRLPLNSSSVENAPCTTLVIAPMSLLAQWHSEAENASKPGTMRSIVYYGSDKTASLQTLCRESNAASAPHVVITSYGVALSEFNQVVANNGNRGSHGGLFSLNFFRVILDEAHHIKNRQSKTAKACYEIAARHRWVLTGTPIVNRLEDLFSLVRFLRVEPWSNFSFWKTFITVPFESKDFIRALDVVQTVLEPLVLRRTKDMKTPDGEPLVPLPPRRIEIEEIELSKQEREVYDYIFNRAKRTFAAKVEAGTVMKSYTTIFAQILRLRQSCCHPVLTRNKTIVAEEEEAAAAADEASGLADDIDLQDLINRFESDDGDEDANRFGAHVLKQIQDESENECPICSEEPMIEQTVAGCWHSACKECLLNYIEHQKNKGETPRCFNCRERINEREIFEVIRHDSGKRTGIIAGSHSENLIPPGSSRQQSLPFFSSTSHAPASDSDSIQSYPHTSTPTFPSSGPAIESTSNVTPCSSSFLSQISLRRIGSHTSAKIAALLTHLKRLRHENPSIKSVVFSQFTAFLDLLEPALARDGIRFLRFDGSMAQKQRAAVLAQFAASPESAGGLVLLLSLRAGGVGLNLTSAQRVFMMDPWWSYAVESQAIDRVHRMGQTSSVYVHRFIVKDSVEQRMLKIQDRKMFIASSLGMVSDEEKKLQRLEDIRELLS